MTTERGPDQPKRDNGIEELSPEETSEVSGGTALSDAIAVDGDVEAGAAAPGKRPPPWVPQGPK
jgi:hypothetical protein